MSTSLSFEAQSLYRTKMGLPDDQILKAIWDYAMEPKNYENGWDVVVEAMEPTEILTAIGCAYSLRGAVKALAPMVTIRHEVMQDAIAAAHAELDAELTSQAEERDETPAPVTADSPKQGPVTKRGRKAA